MLAHVTLLFLTGIVSILTVHPASSFLFSKNGANNDPLPLNYTESAIFDTTYQPQTITYSPNENWIVYSTYQIRFRNVIFFRNRNMYELSSEKQVKIGDSQNTQQILSFAFSKSGDLLFVGTVKNYAFVCNFSASMRDEDCLKHLFLGNITEETGVFKMKTNSANEIVSAGLDQDLWILNFSSAGDLALKNYIPFQTYNTYLDPIWHPNAQQDTLIISSNNKDQQGFIHIFNINQKYNTTFNTTGQIFSISILKDGQTLLASEKTQEGFKLVQYDLSLTKVTEVGIVSNENIRIYWTSLDENIVAGCYCSPICRLAVWSVSPPIDSHGSKKTKKHVGSPKIKLNLLYRFDIYCENFTLSTDINNVLLGFSIQSIIIQFSLCLNNTFFSNMQCLNCSPVCKSCHISPDLCFQCIDNTFAIIKNGSCVKCSTLLNGCLSCSNFSSCSKCIDNTFALMNQSCLKCSSVLDGCLTCSTPSFCTFCDYQKNWNALPQNGSCVCQDFYFISQGQCKPCDSSGACRTCTSQSQCTQCDLYKGYKEKPVDSKCVCRRQFSSVNQKCVECDIEGCERCEKANVCLSCSEENGYESDVRMDGACVKKNSYSIVIILSISGGLLFIFVVVNYVYCKCKGKRNFQRNELKEESYIEDQSYKQILSGGSMDHKRVSVRESVPRFEQIEQILRQSIKKQIKVEVPIAAVNKKEYAKFSDEQKIRIRRLLTQSWVSN